MTGMHRYRTHTCGELRTSHLDTQVRLSGWLRNRRDHGGVLFIDLADRYGNGDIRVTTQQNLIIPNISEDRIGALTVWGADAERVATRLAVSTVQDEYLWTDLTVDQVHVATA